MIKFFYEAVKKQKEANKPYWKFSYKVNKLLVNILYPIFQLGKKGSGIDTESKIIVSLTTYPARVKSVWITITSLLQQTMRPYKVILWLAEEQFPDHQIPASLKKLEKRGLEIRYGEDLKPHKKYFYTIQEYSDYHVITADDDILYPENHIEHLWDGLKKYPNTIICNWSHRIEIDSKGNFLPYNEWIDNKEENPSYMTLAVGCNGILYPPGSLPTETFDQTKIIENSLYTDDLWLKCMELVSGIKSVNYNREVLVYFNLLSTRSTGLWRRNLGERNNNDMVWEQLMNLYPEAKRRLMEGNETNAGNNHNTEL